MEVSRGRSDSSFIHHYHSQILLNDTSQMHHLPFELNEEKGDSSIPTLHTNRMNHVQSRILSIDHNSLSNTCFSICILIKIKAILSPIFTLSGSFNPSITNRFTFLKQSSPITSRFTPLIQLISNTLQSFPYSFSFL